MIETTTMLAVMFLLAGALSPIVSESIGTARAVKAANDAKMIATGMIQFERDLGPSAIVGGGGDGTGLAPRGAPPPEVLISEGDAPKVDGEQSQGGPIPRGSFGLSALGAVAVSRRGWRDAVAASIEDHLITNRAGYRLRTPDELTGWNGPYIAGRVRSDPWGSRYMINCLWLDGGITAADANGRARRAVFVLSAGANGVVETPFDQPISDAHVYGDDIAVRIQ